MKKTRLIVVCFNLFAVNNMFMVVRRGFTPIKITIYDMVKIYIVDLQQRNPFSVSVLNFLFFLLFDELDNLWLLLLWQQSLSIKFLFFLNTVVDSCNMELFSIFMFLILIYFILFKYKNVNFVFAIPRPRMYYFIDQIISELDIMYSDSILIWR